jgi:site-specific DNA-methyltransferase (adenine-specific)
MTSGFPEDWGLEPPNRVKVAHGDSREVIKRLADCSIDSVVTDPPYALVSIQKRFGKPGSAPTKDGDVYSRASAGFMGKQWDTGDTAFDPEFWRDVLRVLKPGGHVLAFGGTRTYHRLACAIENAGFEIRDQVGWLYGSGFPKSHDVSKGIDKAEGAEREVIRERYTAKRIKPGATVVREGAYSKQDVTFTACDTAPATEDAAHWQGWGTALKPAWEPIVLARKPLIGTVAENVLQHGTGALNIDGCRVDAEKPTGWAGAGAGGNTWNETNNGLGKDGEPRPVNGRWPANVIHDGSEEVVAAFPEAGGQRATVGPQHGPKSSVNTYGDYGPRETFEPRGDSGSAARFFYSAKADANDRLGSRHPTVKPVDLMRYLCRLVTPPGGLVLDPFAGSGSTGVACIAEGFRAVLIEREAEYVEDIRRRIAWAQGEGGLTEGEKVAKVPEDKKRGDDLPLFGGEAA